MALPDLDPSDATSPITPPDPVAGQPHSDWTEEQQHQPKPCEPIMHADPQTPPSGNEDNPATTRDAVNAVTNPTHSSDDSGETNQASDTASCSSDTTITYDGESNGVAKRGLLAMYNLPSFEERMKAAKAKLAPPEPEKGIFRTEFYMSMARIPTCPPPDHRCWQVDCEEDGEVYHDPERNAWDWYNDDERRYWESQGWTEPPFEAGEGAA